MIIIICTYIQLMYVTKYIVNNVYTRIGISYVIVKYNV